MLTRPTRLYASPHPPSPHVHTLDCGRLILCFVFFFLPLLFLTAMLQGVHVLSAHINFVA